MRYNKAIFGQAIRYEREYKNMTVDELSRKLNITCDELVYIENGGLDVNIKTILSAMDILEIKPYDLDYATTVKRYKLKELMIEAERIGYEKFMEILRAVKKIGFD